MSGEFDRQAEKHLRLVTDSEGQKPMRIDPPGGGGDNGDMEARVIKLEEAIANLPTKVDFAELRADIAKGQADMHKAIADNHRWTHGALIGFVTLAVVGIVGVMGTIWNLGKPVPAPAAQSTPQAPIIINVPSQAPPAKP